MMISNPWEGMGVRTKRRVDNLDRKFECSWVTDHLGKYGYLIETGSIFEESTSQLKLKGITVTSQNIDETSRLLFFLEEKENWQIFFALCTDLTSASHNQDSDKNFILAVQARLKRWQDLLKLTQSKSMSREMQMGLFTELTCLKNILEPRIGIKQAITSWVGPEADKQDFLLDKCILEIKSYRTSKTQAANISSLGQLYSEKEPIYLMSYALTTSDNGQSVNDLIGEIELLIGERDNGLIEAFNIKLDGYGYVPDMTDMPLLKFIVDSEKAYHVSDEFPKLIPTDAPPEIFNLKYAIDLSKCSHFLVDIDDISISGKSDE